MLECANDRGANGDDAAAARRCPANGGCGGRRNAIRLVEGQARIERGIAGRRDACRQRDRRKLRAAVAQRAEEFPVERETRRREARTRRGGRRSASTRPTGQASDRGTRTGSGAHAARCRPTRDPLHLRTSARRDADGPACRRPPRQAVRAQDDRRARTAEAMDDPRCACASRRHRTRSRRTGGLRARTRRGRRGAPRSAPRSRDARRASSREACLHRSRRRDRRARENRRGSRAGHARSRRARQ